MQQICSSLMACILTAFLKGQLWFYGELCAGLFLGQEQWLPLRFPGSQQRLQEVTVAHSGQEIVHHITPHKTTCVIFILLSLYQLNKPDTTWYLVSF